MKRICGILVCLIAVAVTACVAPAEADDGPFGETTQPDFATESGQETSGEFLVATTESAEVTETTVENFRTTQEESTDEGETSREDLTEETTQTEVTSASTEKETPTTTASPTEPPTPKETQPKTQAPTEPPTTPPTEPPTEPPTQIPAEMASRVETNLVIYSEYIQSVIGLVNARRSASGLKPLEYDVTLCKVATYRCLEIVDTDMFSHTRPDGTPCYTLFDAYGLDYMAAGENLAAGQRSPDEVVTDWMNSPGHRANILGDYTNIGIGVAVDASGCLYWAQSFTKVKK